MDVCIENVFPAVAAPFNSFHEDTRESHGREAEASRARAIPHIVHVVIDEFFASVEQVLDRELRGKPVLVGRGAVVSASGEAKLRGVEPGMSVAEALRLCPDAVAVGGHYEQYADFAEHVQRILEASAPRVEAGPFDDFYLDFAGTEHAYSAFEAMLRRVQAEVLEETGLSVSVGAARTETVAAMASRLEPLCGLRMIVPGTEAHFLAPLAVETLYGLKEIHTRTLAERGIFTIGQLRLVPRAALQAAFGEAVGDEIWHNARGMDTAEAKKTLTLKPVSVTREAAVEGGTTDAALLSGLMEYLGERIASALRASGWRAQIIGLSIRYVDQFVANQTVRLTKASNDERELFAESKELLAQLFTRRVAVQTLGLSVTNIVPDQLHEAELEQCPVIAFGQVAHEAAWEAAALLERAAS